MSPRTLLAACLVGSATTVAGAAQVVFDLPNSIECRDVTPPEFAPAHPMLKVIEAKFRISARVVEGNLADVVDFMYVLNSADKTLRLQDYLPNTTLESAVADNQIEVTDATENATVTGAEAHVAYKIFAIGANHSQSAKKSESNHYKQIAPKELVLASGTTNREHGVFFRLKPSRCASLEGAKEFTFLATVPKSWRGDLCSISCSARARKSSFLSTSVGVAGSEQAQVGMYLVGDAEAGATAEEFRAVQEVHAALVAAHANKENVLETISTQAVGLFTGKKSDAQWRKQLEESRQVVEDVENRLKQLAR
jgi:hypothetical protein